MINVYAYKWIMYPQRHATHQDLCVVDNVKFGNLANVNFIVTEE